MKATHLEPDWVPQRNGEIYCSPACGAHCKWVSFLEAEQYAAVLAKRLGVGWEPRVWENMGWYYSANYGGYNGILSVHPSYTAYLGGGRWVGRGNSPEEAIKTVLTQLDEARAELESLCSRVHGILIELETPEVQVGNVYADQDPRSYSGRRIIVLELTPTQAICGNPQNPDSAYRTRIRLDRIAKPSLWKLVKTCAS